MGGICDSGSIPSGGTICCAGGLLGAIGIWNQIIRISMYNRTLDASLRKALGTEWDHFISMQ
eukprot:15349881-Ditylum_brightwellii.AAC.1